VRDQGRPGYDPGMMPIERVVQQLERTSALDAVAQRLDHWVRPILGNSRIRGVTSGSSLGHPLHPAIVAVPTGAWLSACCLDLFGDDGSNRAARRLVGLGVLAAIPAAATGASDWLDTEGGERRVGLVHWTLNASGVLLYGSSWLVRRRGWHGAGVSLALAGGAIIGIAGWLGGHLAYAMGVGVDTTAFLHPPTHWTAVAATGDIHRGRAIRGSAEGVAVLLVRTDHGVTAMLDRCTHRGAPLHEGPLDADCIECPWHGSRFDLGDGSIRRGPATRPQPMFEVREQEGRIQVRRHDEPRSLRKNPTGA
jgi:nitrite reductase/ring-hydroxylating ferredoxin subunit/uncharacterized membrane protein